MLNHWEYIWEHPCLTNKTTKNLLYGLAKQNYLLDATMFFYHSKTEPLAIRPGVKHLNTEHVRYLDPHPTAFEQDCSSSFLVLEKLKANFRSFLNISSRAKNLSFAFL